MDLVKLRGKHNAELSTPYKISFITVTVFDDEPPTAVCQNISVDLDPVNGTASITGNSIDGGSTDNCGITSFSASPFSFSCENTGPNTVTLTLMDATGNTSTCDATVTVQDVTSPQPDCRDITVLLDENGEAVITPADIDNGSSDACEAVGLTLSVDLEMVSCDNLNIVNVVTLTVTDPSNNSETCTSNVTVQDNLPPDMVCNDYTLELDDLGMATLLPDDIDGGTTDNCQLTDLTIDLADFTCADLGTHTVTLTGTDASDNSAQCTATVTVVDLMDPLAVCQPATIELDGSGNASIDPQELDGGSTDNCTVTAWSATQTAFTCADLGDNPIILIVEDQDGNADDCLAIVTVEDNITPIMSCQDGTVELSLAGSAVLNPGILDGGILENCSYTLSTDIMEFTCADVGKVEVVLTAEDPAGNAASCTANVNVIASSACTTPGISISDPCTCLSDGEFAEQVVIGPTSSNQIWVLSENTGLLDPITLLPILPGTEFTEVPDGMGQSTYVLDGVHLDAAGYEISATSIFFPDVTLMINNLCYYPMPMIVGLNEVYCIGSPVATLVGDVNGVDLISEEFLINGNPATEFDPAALGIGFHTVEYVVDAGTATPFDPTDPGCEATASQVIEVTPNGPSAIACNDLVTVAVGPSCSALITPDMVLEGDYYCYGDYEVTVFFNGNQIPNPVPGNYLGQTLDYIVEHIPSGNDCGGELILEDNFPPVITCSADPVQITCLDNLADVPPPPAMDNCTDVSMSLIDEDFIDDEICDDDLIVVRQVWIAIDDFNNESAPCERFIEISRTTNDQIDFPNDIVWECNQADLYPNILNPSPLHPNILQVQNGTDLIDATVFGSSGILGATGSGTPGNIDGPFCNYSFTHSDQIVHNGCGDTYQIVRTWLVFDECSDELVTENALGEDNIQVITITDVTPPSLVVPDFTLSANVPGAAPGLCTSTGFLPAPIISDNCSEVTVTIITPIGEAIYINGVNGNDGGIVPAPGLGLGIHIITYTATDECGQSVTLEVEVEVIDDIAPTPVCDEITDVNLDNNGLAIVNAITFDDGSTDNCCIEEYQVRRVDGDCDGQFDDFGPTVTFCCDDAMNNPIMVIMRVVDCYGNTNDCEVEVMVNDVAGPTLVFCPGDQELTCDEYLENYASGVEQGDFSVLEDLGVAEFTDNCNGSSALNVDYTVTVNIDACSEGTIIRTWTATDNSGNAPLTCTQTIFIDHVSDWVVEFPEDITVSCEDGGLPDLGEPEIFFDECEMIATSFEDQYLYVVPDACYKINRTWTVINWCVYDDYGFDAFPEAGYAECDLGVDFDGDGDQDCQTFREGFNSSQTPDGVIVYMQTIKVLDEDDPVFNIPAIDGCIDTDDCFKNLVLPYPDIMDECSPEFTVSLSGDFGDFYDISSDVTIPEVEIGVYEVTYAVTDNCGNTAYQTIEIEVEDCFKPTPVCEELNVEIMQTAMIDIEVEIFDAGSYDNCSGVTLSFSSNVNDTVLSLDCDDVGTEITIELWVTDDAGNQDFCTTELELQDNMNVCNNLTVSTAGLIATEEDDPVGGATVDISGGMFTQITEADGLYQIDVPAGGDYSIFASLDEDHGNGVTTWDMVLVMRHILNVSPLTSPYKLIAADANRSGTVSTLDLVDIQKVVLQLEPSFPNNTSWRFVDADYIFPDPTDPWSDEFPEVINYNNLNADQLYADFVGIKIGDINASAQANADQLPQDRSFTGTFRLETMQQELKAGQTVAVPIYAEDLPVFGYQFTMELDETALNLVDFEPGWVQEENVGFALLEEGALTFSWHQAEAEVLPRGPLFTLHLQANRTGQLEQWLHLSSRFTQAEAYGVGGERLQPELAFSGANQAEAGLVLYQNVPNPFAESTRIGFDLPADAEITLTLQGVNGQVVQQVQGHYPAGYNEIRIEGLPTKGVYYYTLQTPTHTAVKKMTVQ
jgi:hypothetical protein